jgi:hypothetical protein
MAPDPKYLKAAVAQLAHAGSTWDAQVGPLRRCASATTGRINLTTEEMGLAAPLHAPYHALCVGMQRVLGEAALQVQTIGDAVRHAATLYQAEEDDLTHKIKGVW